CFSLLRFFNKGQCTWGTNCRFLHPGVSDKGNYNMFAAPKPAAPSEKEDSTSEKLKSKDLQRKDFNFFSPPTAERGAPLHPRAPWLRVRLGERIETRQRDEEARQQAEGDGRGLRGEAVQPEPGPGRARPRERLLHAPRLARLQALRRSHRVPGSLREAGHSTLQGRWVPGHLGHSLGVR
ncbi:UNVERIFIED_CONTAM: hypothetical protein GTU68_065482, partial [Idotea baltica]|nr:hypothetical protein [Idotea baltica]